MKRVAPGFELQLHVGAGVSAVLRRVVGGLHLEFLDGINRRVHEQVVPAVVERTHAVKRDLLVHASSPTGAKLSTRRDHAGRQVSESSEVAAAQRQVDERLRGDHVSCHAALRLQQQTFRHDINHFADLANLESEVQPRHLSQTQLDRPAFGTEARQLGLNDVRSRHQVANLEGAVGTAHDGLEHSGRRIRDGDG